MSNSLVRNLFKKNKNLKYYKPKYTTSKNNKFSFIVLNYFIGTII